jgi:hypothetical protein
MDVGLPEFYRFEAENRAGVTAQVVKLYTIRKKGAITYEGTEATLINATNLADNGFTTSALQDNGTNQYVGADLVFEVQINSGSPNGSVILYFQRATDNTPTHIDSQGAGERLVDLFFDATGTQRVSVSI